MKFFKKTILAIVTSIVMIISPSAVFASTLALSPSTGTFNQSCAFSVVINLDTQSAQTDGTDVVLFYDPTRFNATSILNGTIYNDYPNSNIDSVNGKIQISGIASSSSPFNGKGIFATVNFSVLPAAPTGATAMTFDFDPNDKAKTTDSNVIEHATLADTLANVVNGSYVVGSTGSCAAVTPTITIKPTGAPPVVYLPQGQVSTGTPSASPARTTLDQFVDKNGKGPGISSEATFTLAIVGSVLTVLGVVGLAVL